MTQDRELPPVRKAIEVGVPPAEAFRLWTEAIGRWWPLASHSVAQADALACALEARTGGRIFETTRAGEEHVWGRITVFAPPHRLAFTWHPGRQPDDHTMVEVTFSPTGEGRTRLELTHRGWPRGAGARRANYDQGWQALLRDDFAAYVAAAAAMG
jgi:uncharacterized protein YndB with AHSA1/START domain